LNDSAVQILALSTARSNLFPPPELQTGRIAFADCAVVIEPNAMQMADIAIATAESTRVLMNTEPVVALLNFSTKGSGKGPMVNKVVEAMEIVRARAPERVHQRVHLNPLVMTFSLMIWGFQWDAPGLLLAIPLTAGIKAVCDNVKGLRAFGKFLGD